MWGSRRRVARVAWVTALATLLVVSAGASLIHSSEEPAKQRAVHVVKDTSKRPSIVLILTDDQRWDTLWSMPNVQSLLVEHGATFSNAFVVNSLCCPSRSSILTGDYSHTTGVYQNGGAHGGFQAFHDGSTIATRLHAAGYDTGLVGKYLNGTPGGYVPPGWDRWNAIVMDPARGNYYYNYQLTAGKQIHQYGGGAASYSTTVLADHAVNFIDSARGPMFLYFAPWAPHGAPIPPPGDELAFGNLPRFRPPDYGETDVSDKPAYIRGQPPFSRQEQRFVDGFRRGQYQTLLGVDQAVGRIVAALRATGRLDHTMIVFMSDNGLAWGEHRWHTKQTPYEESIRVPMVISYPPLTPSRSTFSDIALNIDVAPTFAELAGVTPPGHDGRSLMPLLQGGTVHWRTGFLVEHAESNGRLEIPGYCALRTTDALYVAYETGEHEYYDLRSDPYELHNLAGDPSADAAVAALQPELHRLCNPPPPGMSRP